ncbi:bifunctional NAD(P)H-hydrate repair enzyme Nnr [Sideroxyarcus emersonii]|uniref:ADP-dependent (S)-NAD(P)H-hydrate dehydratase n=1 Tax=Sideroxyarcus emersonii TaxID=2764705 RepID=A0AAN1X9J9_9PROT|nr:NAD(P)H-hydrate dehydratase [Sideroxyarcus emersonii]BCK87283.1 bifunctional NAD(P)H-hydrate repair enzyme Nnr [Sideroxyarcus emersonii]
MPTARPATITRKQVAAFLKPRPKDSHKGQFGTVTVIGGANGMVGAAILAGRAAFKMGAGCVHIGLLADKMPLVDMRMPELMLHPAAEALRTAKPDVLLIGCGLGQSLPAQKLLYDALLLDVALVLDADALNIIAQRPDLRGMLHGRKAPAVFTPHPGEAARLLGCGIEDIQGDRPRAALSLAQRLGGSVVLKGAGSLCATRDGKLHINRTGNPGMSSAGMGDVLAGMIAAFIAQGLETDQALLLGVHLHGAAGDELDQQQAMLGMSATEVTEWARWLLNRMAPR